MNQHNPIIGKESMSQITQTARDKSQDWWKGSVIYQVYPRSFQDSNGDGVGDLKGIIQRLPYIADLGADAVWISPFFKSPMKDFGYDVSDYRAIDPMFGSMDDFDNLVAESHKLGLRVIIDLVLSHTSDQHDWFKESRSSRDNPKSDWYVWSDPKPDGTPPNNWLSIFGGSAWQWDSRREQYYLHNFLTSQPDLNFHNLDVQDALLDMARFWLEKGVDGFRLDTINFYVHDKELRSNPALSEEKRNASIAPSVNPYNYQEHIYSKNRPENLEFLQRLRSVMNEFEGRTMLGEVGDAQFGLEILGQYTAGNERAHMCYAFEFLESRPASPAWIKDVFNRLDQVASDGWACWAFSNHDVKRHKTRWNLSEEAARTYATLLMCLRGSACIYQGEELGLDEADISFEQIQDPYGIEFWPDFKGRDGCRTPMVWEKAHNNGGFTSGKSWLPFGEDHISKSVDQQINQPDSTLAHYKKAIALRHQNAAFAKGALEFIEVSDSLLSFKRTYQDQEIYCVFNLSHKAQIHKTQNYKDAITDKLDGLISVEEETLGPWQYKIGYKHGDN